MVVFGFWKARPWDLFPVHVRDVVVGMNPTAGIRVVEPDLRFSIAHGHGTAPTASDRFEVVAFRANALAVLTGLHTVTDLLGNSRRDGYALLLEVSQSAPEVEREQRRSAQVQVFGFVGGDRGSRQKYGRQNQRLSDQEPAHLLLVIDRQRFYGTVLRLQRTLDTGLDMPYDA